MAKRARRRGRRRPLAPAGDLALAYVRRHVPDPKVRLIRLQAAWSEVATARVAERTWPGRIDGSMLSVAVQDNQWLHELAYLRQDLLARIRREVPEAGVESIRLRLGRIPPASQTPRAGAPAPTRARLSAEPPAETIEMLQAVRDGELKHLAASARLILGRAGGREPGSAE